MAAWWSHQELTADDRSEGELVMSTFYAYDNHHRNRARVHRSECPWCNHGQGVQGGSSGVNDQWHGPFDFAEDAYARVSDRADVGYCAFCRPQDREAPIALRSRC